MRRLDIWIQIAHTYIAVLVNYGKSNAIVLEIP